MATPVTPSHLQTTNHHIALRILPGMEELPGGSQPKNQGIKVEGFHTFINNKKWFHMGVEPKIEGFLPPKSSICS